uniref:Uncharacterized protein n=1 Tax=Phenylobacterium glaciei TaxID=2803784 RepID=A0A974P357_9CAUL|nr:hypothetical protein JKL49_22210 [Phenylobacterium glaciei]
MKSWPRWPAPRADPQKEATGDRKALRRLAGLGAAVACVLSLGVAGEAQALPDAKIDQQIRPNFGILLAPPCATPIAPAPGSLGAAPAATAATAATVTAAAATAMAAIRGRPTPLYLDSITVDCADTRGGPHQLADAIYNLADNGVLYIRSRGGSAARLWRSTTR